MKRVSARPSNEADVIYFFEFASTDLVIEAGLAGLVMPWRQGAREFGVLVAGHDVVGERKSITKSLVVFIEWSSPSSTVDHVKVDPPQGA
jgi:hypothetical protein